MPDRSRPLRPRGRAGGRAGVGVALAVTLAVLLGGCGSATAGDASPSTPRQPAPPQELLAPGTPGVSTGYGILDMPAADLDRELDAVAAAGARWVRTDMSWGRVQPTADTWDWSANDRLLTALQRRGLHYLALPLGEVPDWARTGPGGSPDAAAFGRFVSAAAERYVPRGVTVWEIWNEQNTARFWPPSPDPKAYSALLAAAADAVHAADPRALVILGGLAAPADDPRGRWLSAPTFLRQVYDAGAGEAFDAVAVHPYSYPVLPGAADPRSATDPGTRFSSLDAVHDVLEAQGQGTKPVWVTEFGAPVGSSENAVTEAEQAEQITAMFRECRARSWCGPVLAYTVRDYAEDPADAEANFGLLRHDFSRRPAYAAFAAAARTP